jgi:predicted flap endonuclease-1-like 5' DNA nuclease
MVSIFSYRPEDASEAPTAPHWAIGAASPLWLMFGGAAAAGATYWWWASRWREAVNLEAVLALAPEPVAVPPETIAVLEAAPEPVTEAVTLVAETTETVLDAAQEAAETVAEPLLETVTATNDAVVQAVVEPVAAIEPAIAAAADKAVETAEAATETATETAKAAIDDLTRLVGVGPKLAASLSELGVTQFSQIAAWTPDELASYDQLLNLKGRADREAWIDQAKRFAGEASDSAQAPA